MSLKRQSLVSLECNIMNKQRRFRISPRMPLYYILPTIYGMGALAHGQIITLQWVDGCRNLFRSHL
jgi:hypothetical protein